MGDGSGEGAPADNLILGSQNAYFGAFCGPPESDSVGLVPATFC